MTVILPKCENTSAVFKDVSAAVLLIKKKLLELASKLFFYLKDKKHILQQNKFQLFGETGKGLIRAVFIKLGLKNLCFLLTNPHTFAVSIRTVAGGIMILTFSGS